MILQLESIKCYNSHLLSLSDRLLTQFDVSVVLDTSKDQYNILVVLDVRAENKPGISVMACSIKSIYKS